MYHLTGNDTICAISTPPGLGAIAVIRLSGPDAVGICKKIFHPREKGLDLAKVASHTVHFGTIGDADGILDEVLLTVFRAPHSYTGEDVTEISCHGSPYIQQKIIELLLSQGLRLANPGEFTLRAFLNGKFDLSQAEAVADLIASHSRSSHDLAMSQMRGGFSKKIKELRKKLVDFTALIELELDFSEEHIEFASRPDVFKLLVELKDEIELLIKSFSIGNVIKTGIPVTIIGKPNVGKSTLLNAILNEEKAIVSEIPGTTRDSIEDTIVIGGYSFRFIDTAGLRESIDHIEKIGIERTWEKIHEAAIILYVFDATEDSFEEVMQDVSEFRDLVEGTSKRVILVGNKTDKLNQLPGGFKGFVELETIFVSAKRKENIHLLAESLLTSVQAENLSGSTLVANTRHLEALQNAGASIEDVRQGMERGLSPDLLTIDIRKALYHLGEITGEITNDEILGLIFSRFCIGK
jgi:tRNA modification GTPase